MTDPPDPRDELARGLRLPTTGPGPAGADSAAGSTLVAHDFDPTTDGAVVPPQAVVIVASRPRGWWSPFVLPALIVTLGFVVALRSGVRQASTDPVREPVTAPEPAPRPVVPDVVLRVQSLSDRVFGGEGSGAAPARAERDRVAPLAPEAPLPVAALRRPGPPARAVAELTAQRHAAEARAREPVQPLVADAPRDEETARARAEIQAEATRKAAEVAEVRGLMAAQPKMERERKEERLRDLAAERATFRTELKRLLDRFGDDAGGPIWDLADRFHVEPEPGVEQRVARALQERKRPLDRAGRIALFRANGLPETLILAELIRDQMRNVAHRKGPRDRNEAIVRAARQLLALPAPRPSSVTAAREPTAPQP